jgi:amino acid transporter
MGPGLLLLFVVGDVLGAGVYAVTGEVAGQVGGAAWVPFVVAFGVAALTAFSYMELVTRYPRAAGAALYTQQAFRRSFLTFIVAFMVVSSGITSASTAAKLVAANLLAGLDALLPVALPSSGPAALATAIGFVLLLAVVNLRGVGESVKFNVVLTLVEMTALAIVVAVGLRATLSGDADLGRALEFTPQEGTTWFAAVTIGTAVAFFAMVGFEDSVNMVEETREPERIFPRTMFIGLGLASLIYVLVAVTVVVVLSPDAIAASSETDEGVLLAAVQQGMPDFPTTTVFPFLTLFAVANTALINMLMASRMVYGMAQQHELPPTLARVLPNRRTPWVSILLTTALALGLLVAVSAMSEGSVALLAGTTGLLLLLVFAVVNISLLVLRRRDGAGNHFRAPRWTPYLGAVACLFLAGPWARSAEGQVQYPVAAALLVVGGVLWVVSRRGTPGAVSPEPPEAANRP